MGRDSPRKATFCAIQTLYQRVNLIPAVIHRLLQHCLFWVCIITLIDAFRNVKTRFFDICQTPTKRSPNTNLRQGSFTLGNFGCVNFGCAMCGWVLRWTDVSACVYGSYLIRATTSIASSSSFSYCTMAVTCSDIIKIIFAFILPPL